VGGYGLVADYSTFDIDGNRANSRAERQQFNGKLSFKAFDTTQVNLVFNQFDMPLAQDPVGLTTAQMAADPNQAGTNALSAKVRKITSQSQLGTSIKHDIDSTKSITARAYTGSRENTQYQANSFWVGLDRSYYGAGLQYNQQTQVAGKPLSWVAGYEFDYSSERRQGGASPGGEKTPGSLNRDEDNQAKNSDFFVQGTLLAAESISMVAGLRASSVAFKSQDYYLSNGNGSGEVSFQATNPVLGVTYHANEALNLYANYGKGFETPTLAEVAYSGSGSPSFNTAVNASSSQHLELGAKWTPRAGSRVDFTVFQVKSTDEIVVLSSTSGQTTFKNAPGTTRSGWELSGSTMLSPQVRATLAASQVDASYNQAFTSGTTPIAAGNKLPGIPQSFLFSELLWSDQKANAGKQGKALGSQAGLELTQAGRLFANDTNTASAEGYTTLNLKASHGWALGAGSMTAYARIDNLADERYVGSVIVNQAASQFYEPAPGRNWTLGLRLSVPL
jgi:iron complex outermembrane receptor protein